MRYAERMRRMETSFIREILKVAEARDAISFAGGLPSAKLFPVDGIAAAAARVLEADGAAALQYSATEGYLPLREFIAARYYAGCDVAADNILILSGSQQAFDLIGKVFLDPGDGVLLERPGYLGAIQAFSVFEPSFCTSAVTDEGIDLEELEQVLEAKRPKLFHAVTNFQNPTGITYSAENRAACAAILRKHDVLMIEDDPYGELRFSGAPAPPMMQYLGEQVLSLGSFSKIFAPAMRLGWVCCSKEIMGRLISVKQASDLHTNYFSQRLLYQYLSDNDIDRHIAGLRAAYGEKRGLMLSALREHMPGGVSFTKPEGGMFIWLTLPGDLSAADLFTVAARRKVLFVPGAPFYVEKVAANTLRLNYTNSSADEIASGIRTLASAIASLRRSD